MFSFVCSYKVNPHILRLWIRGKKMLPYVQVNTVCRAGSVTILIIFHLDVFLWSIGNAFRVLQWLNLNRWCIVTWMTAIAWFLYYIWCTSFLDLGPNCFFFLFALIQIIRQLWWGQRWVIFLQFLYVGLLTSDLLPKRWVFAV